MSWKEVWCELGEGSHLRATISTDATTRTPASLCLEASATAAAAAAAVAGLGAAGAPSRDAATLWEPVSQRTSCRVDGRTDDGGSDETSGSTMPSVRSVTPGPVRQPVGLACLMCFEGHNATQAQLRAAFSECRATSHSCCCKYHVTKLLKLLVNYPLLTIIVKSTEVLLLLDD